MVALRWYVFQEPSSAFDLAAQCRSEPADGRYRIEIAAQPVADQ